MTCVYSEAGFNPERHAKDIRIALIARGATGLDEQMVDILSDFAHGLEQNMEIAFAQRAGSPDFMRFDRENTRQHCES
jgi:hypothetical protein